MAAIELSGVKLTLLSDKAIYLSDANSLLVSDVHLGKSETFQATGIPVSNQVNQATLQRLQTLCETFQPETLFILGDLFHSKLALVDEVLECWFQFLAATQVDVTLILGNHDRALISTLQQLSIQCITTPIQVENVVLSHEPSPQSGYLNICGHVHPCIRIKSKLDNLRLPCFYVDQAQNILILPSFGEFTGGYEMPLTRHSRAYVIAGDRVVTIHG
ncbi:ligase-associated DNA damage response endonuclease PdeM [Leptolyngbyaceae cyanobacterium UHCC 1019]